MSESSRETEILKSIIDETEYTKTPQSRDEEILVSILNGTEYTKTPQSRIEELYLQLKEKIERDRIVVEPLNVTENGTYTAEQGKAYSPVVVNVSSKPALVPWSTGTDEEIAAMVNGYYDGKLTIDEIKSVWSLGDCRSVDLAAMPATYVSETHRAQTVELQILDFEHDDLTTAIGDKIKALITVDLKDCLRAENVSDTGGSSNSENGYMNSTGTNSGGWTGCKRRQWCNEIFYGSLPLYIKDIVKTVNKKTSAGSKSSTINTDSDYCFMLSEIEVFGSVTYSKNGEGAQYSLFAKATANRYKLPKWNSNLSSSNWWNRSPHGSSVASFCYVYGSGIADPNIASNQLGIVPAFCL